MIGPLIQARSIDRTYHQGDSAVEALCDVSLDVEPGESLAITGPSGCGKTTLLHILGLLDRHFEGEVRFCGRTIRSLRAAQLARIRLQRVGFVFQEFHLIASLSALDNAALPHWRLTGSAARARAKARDLLVHLGLGNRLGHKPSRLSGGEAQRVALARALVNDPYLLLADEPTAHLDESSCQLVLQMFECICLTGRAVVVASHNPAVAHWAGRVLGLNYGRLLQEPGAGDPALLSCRRRHP